MAHSWTTSRLTWIFGLVIAAICCIAARGDEGGQETQTVMQAKLAHSRNLIRAVVASDFQALDAHAREMAAVTRLAAWSKDDSPAYQAESFEFEAMLHLLRELARKENTEGAALACITLTLNCVDCHREMRATGEVKLGDIRVLTVDEEPIGEEPTTSAWMKKKLEYTEKVLAGLVAEDFEAITEAGGSMRSLGRVEGWTRRRAIPRYDVFMSSFNRACERLEGGAKEKNIESAALAYTQLLLSCVNCHSELRQATE